MIFAGSHCGHAGQVSLSPRGKADRGRCRSPPSHRRQISFVSLPLSLHFRSLSVVSRPLLVATTGLLLNHSQQIAFAQNDELLAIHIDLGAGIPAVIDDIAIANADLHSLALLIKLPRAHGDNLPLRWLFLGRIREVNPALGL